LFLTESLDKGKHTQNVTSLLNGEGILMTVYPAHWQASSAVMSSWQLHGCP